MYKLGSLFSGSGGFELAGTMAGFEPVWASEIEAFPIAVTTKRFPNMKHLGDVTKINGGEIEPVDVITFGSPCQDLSVAGKRVGIEGSRSGLFMEAIRIIKEMRRKTNGKYPRYAVWENVFGAFSSGKGEDFRTVLEEFAKVKESDVSIPMPAKNKWCGAGNIVGDGWSVAWRGLNAQFWGVAQRRRRIYLVADFGGESADEVLFEREGVSGYTEASGETREGAAESAERCAGTTGGGNDVVSTICASYGTKWNGNAGAYSGDNFVMDTPEVLCVATQQANAEMMIDKCPTITEAAGKSGNNKPYICFPGSVADDTKQSDEEAGKNITIRDTSGTLRAAAGAAKHESDWESLILSSCYGFCPDNSVTAGNIGMEYEKTATLSVTKKMGVCHVLNDQGGERIGISEDIVSTLRAEAHGNIPCVVENHPQDGRVKLNEDGIVQTLASTMGMGGGNVPLVLNERQYALTVGENLANTLTETDYKGTQCLFEPQPQEPVSAVHQNQQGEVRAGEVTNTLNTNANASGRNSPLIAHPYRAQDNIAYSLDRASFNQGQNAQFDISIQEELSQTLVAKGTHAVASVDCRNLYENGEISGTLQAKETGGYSLNYQNPVRIHYAVRRLTPTECARLQGFPSWWCADIPHSDTAEYKMWGNGIALPCGAFVLNGVAEALRKSDIAGENKYT